MPTETAIVLARVILAIVEKDRAHTGHIRGIGDLDLEARRGRVSWFDAPPWIKVTGKYRIDDYRQVLVTSTRSSGGIVLRAAEHEPDMRLEYPEAGLLSRTILELCGDPEASPG